MFYIFMVIGITVLCIVYLIELDRNNKLERELKALKCWKDIHTSEIEQIYNEVLNVKYKQTGSEEEKEINIKYFSEDYPRLEKIEKGDWIDLRVDSIKEWESNRCILTGKDKEKLASLPMLESVVKYEKGDVIKFGLGVAMELPENYEAIVLPRSSTFTHWGLVQTNSSGVIDNSYNGNNDEWQIEFIAMKDGEINRFDRVCQFRIQKNQPNIKLNEVDKLENKDRGGYGTTGK